jgi:hypothetical protein
LRYTILYQTRERERERANFINILLVYYRDIFRYKLYIIRFSKREEWWFILTIAKVTSPLDNKQISTHTYLLFKNIIFIILIFYILIILIWATKLKNWFKYWSFFHFMRNLFCRYKSDLEKILFICEVF